MTPQTRSYGIALTWTLFLTAVYLGLHYVPIPTAAPLLERLGSLKWKYLHTLNLLALGLRPVIYGFFCLEILSLIVKPLSKWRLEGVAGRQKLNQAAWALSTLFTFIQALGTSFMVKALDPSTPPVLYPPPGLLFHLINIAALMGGTFLAVWLAGLITQLGVGNGFLILALAIWIKSIIVQGHEQFVAAQKQYLTSNELFSLNVVLAGALLVIYFLWKFIQRVPRVPIKRPDGKILWYEISPMPPAAGAQYYVIALITTIAAVLSSAGLHLRELTEGWTHITLEVLLLGLFNLLFYHWLWGDIAVFGLSVDDLPLFLKKREKLLDKQAWKAIAVLNLGAILFWVRLLGEKLESPFWVVTFVILIEIMAVIQDLWAQWTFWRTHGPGVELMEMDNVHLAGYLKGLFQAEGIPCHIQAYGFRRLFFLFAPLNKMRLLVPEDQVERARAALAGVRYQVV